MVTRFDGGGELGRQQRGKRSGFKYCQECKQPLFSKGLLYRRSSGQIGSVTIVAVAYRSALDKISPVDHGTRTPDSHAHS